MALSEEALLRNHLNETVRKMNKLNEVIDDIKCARDWLLPDRPVTQVEIDACISELNDIIKQLKRERNSYEI
jgi:hypothetical protein